MCLLVSCLVLFNSSSFQLSSVSCTASSHKLLSIMPPSHFVRTEPGPTLSTSRAPHSRMRASDYGPDDDEEDNDWEEPISQPGQYPVTASTSSSVGRTLPRQLDPEFYARILRASDPEADFQVPIRAKWLHFSQLEPGHIFMINRPGWTVSRSRASQKRLRGGEDQPCNGGWNR